MFTLMSSGCLYVLITYIANIANEISDKILRGDTPLNIASLMGKISSQLRGSHSNPQNIVSFVVLICWGIATLRCPKLGLTALK